MGLVQSTNQPIAGGTGSATLTGVNASNALIAFIFATSSTSSVPSSPPTGFTAAATYAALTGFSESVSSSIYYTQSPSSGSNTCTVSFTSGGGGHLILVEWSGLAPSALDVVPAVANSSTAGTSATNSIASGTLGQANEVVFVLMAETTNGSGQTTGCNLPATGGFTDIYASGDSLNDWLYDVTYQTTITNASVTAGWAWNDTAGIISQAVMASFKLAAAPASLPLAWFTC